jgi:hypothetical protein
VNHGVDQIGVGGQQVRGELGQVRGQQLVVVVQEGDVGAGHPGQAARAGRRCTGAGLVALHDHLRGRQGLPVDRGQRAGQQVGTRGDGGDDDGDVHWDLSFSRLDSGFTA